jgi:hypothetical protein
MNKNKFYKKLTSGIFYFSILLFIIAFNFSDNGGRRVDAAVSAKSK